MIRQRVILIIIHQIKLFFPFPRFARYIRIQQKFINVSKVGNRAQCEEKNVFYFTNSKKYGPICSSFGFSPENYAFI